MDIDIRVVEAYYVEAGVILAVFILLLGWSLRGKIKNSKTLDRLALALPIAWMILGALWTYLRITGIVSVPW
ncbi:MAG TPA: hypothetical protein VLM38_09055 [Blastocatellia bacterium]|nr:hypothetical protein [Blastocatellia bacterium]